MQFTRQCDFNWMWAERIDLVSATWKSINVTHSCWALAFIVVDLSRISVVLMIKLNFTFVLSSMLAVASRSWCISSIQSDFGFNELIHYIGDCRCTCVHQPIYFSDYRFFSHSRATSLIPAFSFGFCIDHNTLEYHFFCSLFGIDENRYNKSESESVSTFMCKFEIVLANCFFPIETVCWRLLNGSG